MIACPEDRLEELYRLRASVWLSEGAKPSAFGDGRWTDARDASRQHWIAICNGTVIGGASLSIHASLADVEEPEAYLPYDLPQRGPVAAPARVIVNRVWRGRSPVFALLDAQDRASRAAGAALAVRQASRRMQPLLERRGWRHHGPAPFDPRFPHEQFAVMSWVPGPP